MFNLTPAVKFLLLANIAILLLQMQGVVPNQVFALHLFTSPDFRPWQLVTHMFMHGGWGHLFNNMLSLFFFGSALEQHWGTPRFTAFYLVCGLGASLCYNGVRAWEVHQVSQAAERFIDHPTPVGFARIAQDYGGAQDYSPVIDALRTTPNDPDLLQGTAHVVRAIVEAMRDSPMLGASGAVFGILFAFGYLFPNTYLYLYFAVPIKAKYFVFLYGAYELWSGVHRAAGDNVAHVAHLGGMVFAFILLKYWERNEKEFY